MFNASLENKLRMLLCGGLSLAVLPMACEEQHADAVVFVGSDSGVNIFGGRDGAAGAGFDDGPDEDDTLCRPCDEHSDCGKRGDLCLEIWNEYRCGQDCDGDWDCPPEYDCVRVQGLDDKRQCVPDHVSCSQLLGPELSELRSFIFDLVNDIRKSRGLYELRWSGDCLGALAQEAVEEYRDFGNQGTKFWRECASRIPNCECNWQGESQAFVRLGSHGWQNALEDYFDGASSDPDRPFFNNVVSRDWEWIGIGGLADEDYVLISLDFAP